jgi:hypothetical protein
MSARISRLALVAAFIGLGSAAPNQYGYGGNSGPSHSTPTTLKPTSSVVPPHPYGGNSPHSYVPSGVSSPPSYVPSGVSGIASYPTGSASVPGVSYTPITQTVTLTTTVPCEPYTSKGAVYSSTASYITTTVVDYTPKTTLDAHSSVPGGGSPYHPGGYHPESVPIPVPTSGTCGASTVYVTVTAGGGGGGGGYTTTETVTSTVTVTPPGETLAHSSVPGVYPPGTGGHPSGTGGYPQGTGIPAPKPTYSKPSYGGPGPESIPIIKPTHEKPSGYGGPKSVPTLVPTYTKPNYGSGPGPETLKPTHEKPNGYGGPETIPTAKPTYSKPSY